jgi:hypothetical protein
MKKRGGLTLIEDSDLAGKWQPSSTETIEQILDRVDQLAGKAPERWPEEHMLLWTKRIRRWRNGDPIMDAALPAAYSLGYLAAHVELSMQKSREGRADPARGGRPRGRPKSENAQPESVKRRLRRSRSQR